MEPELPPTYRNLGQEATELLRSVLDQGYSESEAIQYVSDFLAPIPRATVLSALDSARVAPTVEEQPVILPAEVYLGRAESPTGKSTTKPPPNRPDAVKYALLGVKAIFDSSWFIAAQFLPELQEMRCWFKEGYSCRVLEVSPGVAQSLFEAPSKGTWYHSVVLGPNYVKGRRETAAYRWIDGV